MSSHVSELLLRAQSDVRLAALAGRGQERAFTVLVERYRGPLLRAASRVVGPDHAEDALQQTMLRAWGSISSGTDVRHVRGWLFHILRNVLHDEQARSREHAALTDELADPTVIATTAERSLELAATLAAVARLPERQRYAITQTALAGRSRDEVARDLGLSEGAVRQLLFRARSSLRHVAAAVTPWPLAAWAAQPRSNASLQERIAGLISAGGASATAAWSSSAGTVLSGGMAAKAGAGMLAVAAMLSGALAITGGSRTHRQEHPGVSPAPAARRLSTGATLAVQTQALASGALNAARGGTSSSHARRPAMPVHVAQPTRGSHASRKAAGRAERRQGSMDHGRIGSLVEHAQPPGGMSGGSAGAAPHEHASPGGSDASPRTSEAAVTASQDVVDTSSATESTETRTSGSEASTSTTTANTSSTQGNSTTTEESTSTTETVTASVGSTGSGSG